MFTWPQIILLILKLADALMTKTNQDEWMKAGADAELAKIAARILQKTATGKAIMEKVNAMSAADVDAGLAGLEPK